MKSALVSIIILSATFSMHAQNGKLPETWTKDFEISYSFGGSMDGSRTSLTFTFDSCVYVRNTAMKAPKTTKFRLTEADRNTILQKMRDLKINEVTSKMSMVPMNDGWSSLLCVGTHCINGGSSAEMTENDKQIFSEAQIWLENYAGTRRKRQKI